MVISHRRILSVTLLCVVLAGSAKFLVLSWSPFVMVVPPLEPLLFTEQDFNCERLNLIPRSDLVLVAQSDHRQSEAVQDLHFVYGWPWTSRFEQKARIVQSVRVQASLTPAGDHLIGKTISYFHYFDLFPRKNCATENLLNKGTYIVFLKEASPGRLRAARDRYSTVLKLTDDLNLRLQPRGRSQELQVFSMFFDAAMGETSPFERYERLHLMFHLIRRWEVEAEVISLWKEASAAPDPLNAALACLAGANTFWWDLSCSINAPSALKKAWPDHPAWIVESPDRSQGSRRWDELRQDWKRDPNAWRARTIERYGTQIAASLEHKLLIY